MLSEIQYALQQLLEQKQVHRIDLRAMPWSPGEKQKLEDYLGQGEVAIELNTLGKSTFYETQFSGVWFVSHYNQDGEVIAKLIEITYLPEMIFSQHEDIKNSLERLQIQP
ncbi:MAG: hydrogenase expression/formation protein [gamma proteobacterium symbiont of Bathyaustriella thionipta]|nr:hydrogenase expression/formation protein [gamma proteobacterium symbiont of Bathyaustriella thionipta]MCU7951120.1 hydrogenase expression/formation protein [gamma proteobacterium symbiont of Bathyaustriella thionipta]MCU7953329.1 hydrogenase expression/formation protein [gamma proteobacterium symbiont of Bathyaustriella thionipta]MCU7957635.1 hydrogenase expression/formation protein [gamma proteobacterium symbiont of Bathyaustriella thionipta]MCU7967324.1 hydrogenase expression/formation pro